MAQLTIMCNSSFRDKISTGKCECDTKGTRGSSNFVSTSTSSDIRIRAMAHLGGMRRIGRGGALTSGILERAGVSFLSRFAPPISTHHLARQPNIKIGQNSLTNRDSGRYFASSSTPPPPPGGDTDFPGLRRFEDANPTRIEGINVNPDGIGSTVLPGNLVYKYYKWTGNTRKIPLELAHGYFWMLNDLKKTGGKTTLPNNELIPEDQAQTFPMLTGLESLSRIQTDLPYTFISDKDVKCTLVNISFRDSGYKNIASWMDPFLEAFEGNRNVAAVKVSITERRSLYFLRRTLANLMRKNTPAREHDTTLLYFGSDVDDFRDVLRMHNIMVNYVFLVDCYGQVRFASSGVASAEELNKVIGFANDLCSETRGRKGSRQRKK